MRACVGGTTCQAGTCVCDVGFDLCGDTCVDFQTDRENCGGCGIACAGYEECVAGICKYDGDQCGGEARAIDISRVSLYQAVETDLFNSGSMVGVDQRAVDVVQGRDAMVRVFVEPQAGFTSRELSARIFVDNAGDIQVFHHKMAVSGASSQGSLDSTFRIEVPANVIQGATNYWVELVECAELPAGTVGTARVPTTAGESAALEAIETGVIKVVFVPLTHDGRTPDISQATIEEYARDVERLYPTVGVEWSVRDAIVSNQSGTSISLGNTLDQVTSQRETDGVERDVYYYGLIDPADSVGQYCGGGCTTGVGWVPGADSWGDRMRASVGVGFGTWGVGTFSHELGHNHGRNHAPCGGAGGPDQSFPYGDGGIGIWGYDPDTKSLKDPGNHKDFMGYCDPNWVSDYSFNAYADRIRALNGVSPRIVQPNVEGPLTKWYRMVVTETDVHWWSPVEGPGAPGKNAEPGLVYDAGGNVIAQVDVYRVEMSHSDGYMLYVPEPQSGWHSVGAADGPALAF